MTTDSENWTTYRLVVLDVEGNGAQPPELVEVGIVVIDQAAVVEPPHTWLVKPAKKISAKVTAIHGIKNSDVAKAQRFEDVAHAVRDVLRDDYVVAHSASVDVEVLSRQLPGWKPRGVIDTLRLARRFLPGRGSYALGSLIKDLELMSGSQGAHRAGYDALAAARLFTRLARDEKGQPRPLTSILAPIEPPGTGQGSLF